jgi:hypothetical protein
VKKTKLTSVLLVVFALSLAACSGPAAGTAVAPGNSANTMVSTNTNASGLVPAGPGTAVTAQDLGKEYQHDPAVFDQKYKGKTLTITGNAILAGQSGDHFAIMLSAVEDEAISKSVNIECSVANSEQANDLGKAVDASLEQAKKSGGSTKGIKYPGATIKGVYEYSPRGADHGETMPIISLSPCELTAVTKPE